MQLQQQQTLFETCNSLQIANARKSCVYSLALKVEGCLPPDAKELAFTSCKCFNGICGVCDKKEAVFSTVVPGNKCLDITVEQYCTNFLNKNKKPLAQGLPTCISTFTSAIDAIKSAKLTDGPCVDKEENCSNAKQLLI